MHFPRQWPLHFYEDKGDKRTKWALKTLKRAVSTKLGKYRNRKITSCSLNTCLFWHFGILNWELTIHFIIIRNNNNSFATTASLYVFFYIICILFSLIQEELRDNLTVSVMSFVPTLDDDGKPITCRAENPNVTSLFLETSWTISVVCKYLIVLQI